MGSFPGPNLCILDILCPSLSCGTVSRGPLTNILVLCSRFPGIDIGGHLIAIDRKPEQARCMIDGSTTMDQRHASPNPYFRSIFTI